MGLTKTELFSERQNALANLAKALGHPARIAILEYLLQVDRCICGDIVDKLPLAQPTVSQHLRELKSVGLIQGNIEGVSICYCIHKENWARYGQFFADLFARGNDNNCC